MASPYNIAITNGSGTENILNGDYDVVASITGYDNSTINPSSGTAIVGATFVRTDASGTIYGDPVTSDASGNAVFNNVPFADTQAPTIYFKQTASDANHEFNDEVSSTTMTTSTKTIEILNAPPASRTFSLTDANYSNLPIENGSLTLNTKS